MDDVKKLIKKSSKNLKSGNSEPNFFELVRRFENINRGMPRVGKAQLPNNELIRFGQSPYLKFPETSISEIDTFSLNHNIPIIYVYFFGLLGVNGPMPLEFTDYVFQRTHNNYDNSLRRFLDIIHHRMLSLFYRAWTLSEQAVNFDRKEDDLIGSIISSLSGNIEDITPKTLPDYTLQSYGRFFSLNKKTADNLAEILSSFFNLPIKIIERVESSHDIPNKFKCLLGNKETSIIGKNAQIGSKYYSNTQKFVIEIGPIDIELCRKMLPISDNFQKLINLINMYVDKPLEYDVKFVLKKGSNITCKLDGRYSLGRGMWAASNKYINKDVVVNISASRLKNI